MTRFATQGYLVATDLSQVFSMMQQKDRDNVSSLLSNRNYNVVVLNAAFKVFLFNIQHPNTVVDCLILETNETYSQDVVETFKDIQENALCWSYIWVLIHITTD